MISLRNKVFSIKATRFVAGMKKLVGKSPMQAKRSAIKLQDKAMNAAVKGKIKLDDVVYKAAHRPGDLTKDIVVASASNPVAATFQAVPIPGVGAVGLVGERALKSWRPYRKTTITAGRKARGSKILDSIGDKINDFGPIVPGVA